MKKYFSNNIYFVFEFILISLLCLLPILVLYKWFNNDYIIYFWDATVPLNPEKNIQDFYYLWKNNLFPGFSDPAWSWLPYVGIFYIFNFLFKSLSSSQAVLYWILMSSSLITFYYLTKTLLKETLIKHKYVASIIAFFGAVLYTFNLYVFYYSFRIFNPQEFIISFLPLNFLALIKLYNLYGKGLNTKKSLILWIFIFFISLFLMVPGFSNLIFFLEYYFLIFFYLAFYSLIKRKFTLSFFINIVLFLAAVLFFNFWWLFPMILGLNDTFDAASGIGTTIYFSLNSQLSYLLNSLRMIGMPPMQTSIFVWEDSYTMNYLFTLPLFIFPLLILFFAANLKKVKLKYLSIFLFIIFTASLFLIKGENPPFSFVTEFAFNKIPFFGVFRDSFHKAGLFYMFAYFILVTLSLGLLYEKVILMKKKFFLLSVTAVLVIIGTVIMTAPFFVFDNIPKLISDSNSYPIEFSAKTKIPQEYFDLKPILENNCKSSEVMVIPKTSILTSAYWGKDESYIGQDMLHYLINCSFIATQLSQNKPDSFTTAPYLMLQESDLDTFKNYLTQNQISLILLRKDYVSNRYTDLVPLDMYRIMDDINGDSDFEKVYENNFFTLVRFGKNKLAQNNFQIPSSIVYTNLSLNSASEFSMLTRISSDSAGLYINTSQDYEKYKNYINGYIFEANCVDCVKINISKFQVTENRGFIQTIKEILKPYFKQQEEYLEEQKISIEIVSLNNKHAFLLESLNKKDLLSANKNLNNYSAQLKKTYSLLKNFKSDFFTVNNKKIEMKSFLNAQNEQMKEFFEKEKAKNNSDSPLEHKDIEEKFTTIISDQRSLLEELKKDIYGTDKLNRIFRFRLDIPMSADYQCFADVKNDVMSLTSLTIDDYTATDLTGVNELYLSEGSHKVEVAYSDDKILNSDFFSSFEKTNELKIGRLNEGRYAIKFKTDPKYAGQPFRVVISKGKLDNFLMKTIFATINNIVFHDVILDNRYVNEEYNKEFTIEDFNIEEAYYIYFIPYSLDYPNPIYSNLIIEKSVDNEDLEFYCYTESFGIKKPDIEEPSVKKINATEYKMQLPKNFSSGFITFNQSFNDSWQAYNKENNRTHTYDHIKSGYSNAWFIDSNKGVEVDIVFSRQKVAERTAIISFILFIITFTIFIYVRAKSLSWKK